MSEPTPPAESTPADAHVEAAHAPPAADEEARLRAEILAEIKKMDLKEKIEDMRAHGIDPDHPEADNDYAKLAHREIIKARLKKAAAMAGAGIGAGAAALKKGAKAVKSTAKAGSEAVGDIASSGKNAYQRAVTPGSGWYWLFLLVTLLLHFFYFLPLASSAERVGYFILIYLVVMIFVLGIFWFFRRGDQDDIRGALIATFAWLILYMLPGLFARFVSSDDLISAMSFIVAFIPVWPVFMASRIEETTQSRLFHFLFNLYKLAIVLIVLFFAASALLDFGGPRFSQVNWGSPVDIMGGFWDFLTKFWEKVIGVITGTGKYVDRLTNPNAYYTGQIEESEKVPLGVEIESLRPIDKYVTNETPVIVYGNVRARPMKGDLFEAESVTVIPSCNIDRKDAPEGSVDTPSMELIWGAYGQFQCEFPPLQKKGTYAITGTVTFPFETWAYIPYAFVDEERAKNIARTGKDLRTELGIPETPVATYTSGPIMLGMGGTSQPIIVRLDKTPILAEGSRIGITLDSNWEKGKLFRVKQLELKVPEQFTLESCDREVTRTEQAEEGYTSYVFENPSVDVVTMFTSVTCKLALSDKEYATQLVQADMAERTFIGHATYEYTIDEKTTVQVR